LKKDPTMRRKNSKVTSLIFHRSGATIRALWADRRGVSAIVTGLAAMVLMGFAGLAIDVARWQVTQRHMQGAADQAAIGAVLAYLAGGGDNATVQAKGITANYGFTDGQSGVAVSVTPVSPSPTGYDAAYTVSITQPQPQYFSSLFLPAITVGASAEAATASNGPCILGLGTSGQDIFLASGGGTQVELSNCDLDVNSSNSKGTEATGGARVFAQNINIDGGSNPTAVSEPDWASCSAGICYSNKFKTGVTTPDPYANRTAPTPAACPASCTGATHDPTNPAFVSCNGSYTATTTIYPGTYCGGITINAGPTVTMNPGVYVLTNQGGTQGKFTVSGAGASVTGTGVTIFLTGNGGADIKIQGGSTATLTAPTSGETAGIVFWNAGTTSSAKNQVTGGSTGSITGAIYAPSEEVDYTGGSSTGTGCTQIVADIVQLSGGSYFQHNCSGTGVSDPASSSRVALVQ
jgi:Flp pilus assembly protein TadG